MSSVALATLSPFATSCATYVRFRSASGEPPGGTATVPVPPPPVVPPIADDQPRPAPQSSADTNVSGVRASISTASRSGEPLEHDVARNAHCDLGAFAGVGALAWIRYATASNSAPRGQEGPPSWPQSTRRRGVGVGARRALASEARVRGIHRVARVVASSKPPAGSA